MDVSVHLHTLNQVNEQAHLQTEDLVDVSIHRHTLNQVNGHAYLLI